MWASWSDFVAMGGYGLYVWGSYLVTFALIALELAVVRRRGRAALEDARGLRAAEGGVR
jgi:heme exporter protein D